MKHNNNNHNNNKSNNKNNQKIKEQHHTNERTNKKIFFTNDFLNKGHSKQASYNDDIKKNIKNNIPKDKNKTLKEKQIESILNLARHKNKHNFNMLTITMPSAEILARYEDIYPGALKQILNFMQKQQKENHEINLQRAKKSLYLSSIFAVFKNLFIFGSAFMLICSLILLSFMMLGVSFIASSTNIINIIILFLILALPLIILLLWIKPFKRTQNNKKINNNSKFIGRSKKR